MTRSRASVLITDCDNTLFDWVDIWYSSFAPMLDVLVSQSGVPQNQLIAEIKKIHQHHGTSEYAFLIEELPSLKAQHPGKDLIVVYADAIDAFRQGRRSSLKLYPTVLETLTAIKQNGATVIAYTESMAFYSMYRLRKLQLDGVLDALYSPPDHQLPERVVRKYCASEYKLSWTAHRYIPSEEVKPNPRVLLDIIAGINSNPEDCVYVGDSLMKDIAMANQAAVPSVHARYGEAHQREEYELLRAVTHWPDAQVAKEQIGVRAIPDYVLENAFGEILDFYEFGPPTQ